VGLLSARSKGSLALFEALAERDKLSGLHLGDSGKGLRPFESIVARSCGPRIDVLGGRMTADKKRSRSPALSSKLPELLPEISLRHGQAIWLLTELGGVKVTAAR
jgi:hypothetical protein